MFSKFMNLVLFLYIMSLYLLQYIPGYNILSNLFAALFISLTIVKMLFTRKKIKFNFYLIIFLMFIVISLLSFFVALNGNLVLQSVKTLILIFILVWALINYIDNLSQVESIMKYFVISGLAASFFILLNLDFQAGTRVGSELGNLNDISVILGISYLFSLYFILYEKKKYFLLPTVILLVFIILTGSRSGLLFLLIGTLCMLYFKNRTTITAKIKYLFFIIAVIFIAYLLVFKIPIFYEILGVRLENMFELLLTGDTNEASIVNRKNMIEYALLLFTEKPILGYGVDNFRVFYGTYSHNNFVELLVGLGIIGAGTYYLIYFHQFNLLFKMMKKGYSYSYVFFSIVLASLTINISRVPYKDKEFYIIFAIVSVLYGVYLQQKRTRNSK